MRRKLTAALVNSLALPHTGRTYHHDTITPGLCVCVTATGTRIWYLYRWVKGRPRRIRLALTSTLSPEAARKLASKLLESIARGDDPRPARGKGTFGEAFAAFLTHKRTHHPKSVPGDEDNHRLHLAAFDSRPLGSIRREDIARLHSKIGTKHPYQANRVLSLLSSVFRYADRQGANCGNPASNIQRFKETPRNNYIRPASIPAFFTALDKLQNQDSADALRMALYTGQRRGNVMGMRWEDIDLEAAVWLIPDTKANRPHTVPLVGAAMRVLCARSGQWDIFTRRRVDDCPWVFPSPFTVGHLSEMKKAWKRVCKLAGLEGFRIHDLRHTLASWQAAQGTSLQIIGAGLGHSTVATTQRYAHLDAGTVRAAMEGAVGAMERARSS